MPTKTFFHFLIGMLVILGSTAFSSAEKIVLVGGTVVDVSDHGNSKQDLPNAAIMMEAGKIDFVGKRSSANIPGDAQVIDISGTYVLPGLIDGFAALDNQAFANAYLYMGVTSIIGVYDGRRHPLIENANPSPSLIPIGAVGEVPVETNQLLDDLEKLANLGMRVVLLMYGLTPEQLKIAVRRAHELGLATVGELGATSYGDALEAGVDVFVHSTRYALDLAPAEMRKAVAANPFGPPARLYSQWLTRTPMNGLGLERYAKMIGQSRVALLPTLSLYGIDLPENTNPWQFAIARIINPKDIHLPVDPATGKHAWPAPRGAEEIEQARRVLDIEREYVRAGAKYLAGSGTDVFGTLPGISLHQELFFLNRIGLAPRQVLAASTSNFSAHLGLKDIGEIREGRRADIIILDKNPAEDLKNLKSIRYVFRGGKMIDRSSLINSNTPELDEKPQMTGRPKTDVPPGLGNPKVLRLTDNVIAVTDLYHSAGPKASVNAGIIFTKNSVIFIDSGMTIASAEYLWKIAKERMSSPRNLYLILTHHHSDHVFGMRVFKDKGAKVIAHPGVNEFLANDEGYYKRFIMKGMGWDQKTADETLGDVRLSAPDQVIDKDEVLKIDGEEIRVLYTPGHVLTELAVYHPASGTLFAGDALYEGSDPTTRFGGPDQWKEWIAQLKRLKKFDFRTIVPGHGNLCALEEIERNIAFLEKKLGADGK